jgi:hypothetical protein
VPIAVKKKEIDKKKWAFKKALENFQGVNAGN